MGYSLRTRSASQTGIETPKKAVASKPAVKKAAEIKKVAKKTETKKVEKKTETKKNEKKTEIKKVADTKKVAEPKKVAVKPAAKKASVKKVAAPKNVAKEAEAKKTEVKKDEIKSAAKAEVKDVTTKAAEKATAKKAPVKKATTKAPTKKTITKAPPAKATTTKATAAKAAATKKATGVSKPAAKKAASTPKKAPIRKIAAPIVTIEEVSSPSLPEVEPITHEEPEEKIIEIVEGQVVSTHIRFSDDETEDIEMKKYSTEAAEKEDIVEASKEVSITSSDFEALDDYKEEPTHFELYNSESETEENETKSLDKDSKDSKDEFDEEEPVKKESPAINAHSAFEAFTSQETPKTFNWNKSGSTYYQKPAEPVEETKSAEIKLAKEDIPFESVKDKPFESVEAKTFVSAEPVESAESAPTVIANPFGFGFTSTNVTVSSAPAPVATSRPNPFSFNSHFQSVSSPLDKLCNLTSKANPLPVASSNFSFGTSSIGTSSFLPTSPAAGFSKVAKSPSDKGEDKEERSPSVIQSIIIDDKHEDFSAF